MLAVNMKLGFPPELLDALPPSALIAGGSVLRRMLGAPMIGADIDVFFADKTGRDDLFRTMGRLLKAGYEYGPKRDIDRPAQVEYIHERHIMTRGGVSVDLIYHERWGDWEDVLKGFDISAAQVGYAGTGST